MKQKDPVVTQIINKNKILDTEGEEVENRIRRPSPRTCRVLNNFNNNKNNTVCSKYTKTEENIYWSSNVNFIKLTNKLI